MSVFVTVTGYKHYYGLLPFDLDTTLSLRRDPQNEFDPLAIAVYSARFGKVGYVGQSRETVAVGTNSAAGIYDFVPENCTAIVRFIAGEFIIAELMLNEKGGDR